MKNQTHPSSTTGEKALPPSVKTVEPIDLGLSDDQFQKLLDNLGIREHEGWEGMFSDKQAQGAWPNGSKIVKTVFREGDLTPMGTVGTVLGSIASQSENGFLYFIEWENKLKWAVGTSDDKIGLL